VLAAELHIPGAACSLLLCCVYTVTQKNITIETLFRWVENVTVVWLLILRDTNSSNYDVGQFLRSYIKKDVFLVHSVFLHVMYKLLRHNK